MKKINNIKYTFIAIVLASSLLMSFNPTRVNDENQESSMEMLQIDASEKSRDLEVGWKEVHKFQHASDTYYILYSDLISGIDPDIGLSYGCGHLDVDIVTPGWQCNVSKTYFNAYGYEGCAYIAVKSLVTPTQGNPAVHTIDFRVRDNAGTSSNNGAITLYIHYVPIPNNMQTNPCQGI